MEQSEIEEQVNRKFIRPTYRPFQDKPKKIIMHDRSIPTYKIPSPEQEKTPINTISDIGSTYDEPLPNPFSSKVDSLPKTFSTNVKRLQSPKKQNNSSGGSHCHNCYDVYNDIQNCPVCKNVYGQRDGVYLAIIVILSVIILFMLKKMYIDI
jgi:hypothetical protein